MKKNGLKIATLAISIILCNIGQAALADEETSSNSQLPIKKVVLYKHGVGYFERTGEITGGQTVTLQFKRDQMNDLIKSLTAIDLSGSPIGAIVYDSTKTVDQLLADYSFNLRGPVGLPQLLQQLQGSDIEIAVGQKKIAGRLVGVEQQTEIVEDTELTRYYLTIADQLGDISSIKSDLKEIFTKNQQDENIWPNCMRRISFDEITAVRLLDERQNKDIQRYLKTLFQQHRRDEKNVTIATTGQGTSQLLVSYVTETPVWKATYRIVLPENQEDSEKPFLQGWAVVDNVSEEDWKDVKLSLVSGLPISFVQNLYDPWYKKRPVVRLEEESAIAPVISEETAWMGTAAAPARALKATGVRRDGKRETRTGDMPAEAELRFDHSQIDMDSHMRQLESKTLTREIGDLFEYQIDHPVTIQRNRSALLPIVAKEIDGETVGLYNESNRGKNPLSAVRLTNSTQLTLEGGPLTVLQGASYLGEALTKTIKPNEQRYISYAVDLGMHVNTKHGSKTEKIDHVIINRGTIRRHRAVIETKTYNLNNKTDKDKIVVIEHPIHKDWRLLNEQKPIEITDNYQRFEITVPANSQKEFQVKEERDSWDQLAVGNITPEDIAVFVREGQISDKTRKQLEKIIDLKTNIVSVDRQINRLEKERSEIGEDQNRIRNNLRSLGQSAEEKELRSRYILQLNAQETRLGEIHDEIKKLQTERNKKQKLLERLIEQLSQDLRIQKRQER